MTGLLDGYEFFFDDGSTPVQSYPAIDQLVFADQLDETFRFFRKVIETPMVFLGADYAYLRPLEDAGCGQIDFVVEYQGAEVYRGLILFGTENIEVDVTACAIAVRIEPQDVYTCLLQGWEEEVNLFDGQDRFRAAPAGGELEYETCTTPQSNSFIQLSNNGAPVTCLDSADPGGLYEDWTLIFWEIEEVAPGTWRSVATFARERATTDCAGGLPVAPPGDGWLLESDDCAGDNSSTWVRAPSRVFVPEESVNDVPGEQYKEVWRVTGVPEGEEQRPAAEYGNGLLLRALLVKLAQPCGLTVRSDFYNTNPDGSAPSNDEYTAAAADLANVLIYQKSDIKRPTAFQSATIALWSLKGLLEHLAVMHAIGLRVEGNLLRIEHATYWQAPSSGLDLTAAPYEELAGANIRYTNTGAEVVRRERWEFGEETSFEFSGFPIHYPACVTKDAAEERQYPMPRANNDMDFITANPDRISDDGFTFAAAVQAGASYFVPYTNVPGTLGGQLALNAAMGIPLLLDKYHRHRRPLPTGILNAQLVTFSSAIPRRELSEVTVIVSRSYYHNTFDPAAAVTTALGPAEVAAASWNAADCSLTLTLKA